jgi:hypothetical protein
VSFRGSFSPMNQLLITGIILCIPIYILLLWVIFVLISALIKWMLSVLAEPITRMFRPVTLWIANIRQWWSTKFSNKSPSDNMTADLVETITIPAAPSMLNANQADPVPYTVFSGSRTTIKRTSLDSQATLVEIPMTPMTATFPRSMYR